MPNPFRKRNAGKLKRSQKGVDSETYSQQTPPSDKFDPSHGFNELRADRPKKLDGGKVGHVLDQYQKQPSENDGQKPKGTGRRPSVEERTMKDAYHAGLIPGGVMVSSDDEVAEVQGPSASEHKKEESSNTQDAQPVLTDAPESKMITILCGRQDPESRYFTRRLVRVPDKGTCLQDGSTSPSGSVLNWPELDPYASELYHVWRQTGTLPRQHDTTDTRELGIDPTYAWIASWPLMNAVIQGHERNEVEFTVSMMELLNEQVVKGVRPDEGTVTQLFGEHAEVVPDILKRFVVERWLDADVKRYDTDYVDGLPTSFAYAVLKVALKRLAYIEQSTSLTGREDAAQETWQEHLRHQGSNQAMKPIASNAEQSNTVQAVEQQNQKAMAQQELRNQTGKSWVGFRRLDAQMDKVEEVASSPENPVRLSGVVPPCPPEESQSTALVSPMFGAAQADGAVDDVNTAPPTRKPPPPPALVPGLVGRQHETMAASDNVLPAYADVPLGHDSPAVIGQADGSYSLHPSLRSAPSVATTATQAVPKTEVQARKRITCPGAFPESRPGSLRSVTPGRGSSLDAA
jgi:hypothetical protein